MPGSQCLYAPVSPEPGGLPRSQCAPVSIPLPRHGVSHSDRGHTCSSVCKWQTLRTWHSPGTAPQTALRVLTLPFSPAEVMGEGVTAR